MIRLVTGAVLAVLTVAGVLAAPVSLVWGVLLALAARAAWEMRPLIETGSFGMRSLVTVLGAAGLAASFGPLAGCGVAAALVIVVIGFVLVSLLDAVRHGADFEIFAKTAAAVFVTVYLGVTFGFVGATFELARPSGRHLLLFGMIVVYSGDTLAYYGGRALGRRKLAPRISPGKTIEGAACGVAAAVVAGAIAGAWLVPSLSTGLAAATGLLLGVSGALGDLFASVLKRSASVKDSGSIFPGHGGVLDRLDSLLLAAPLLYGLIVWTVGRG